MKKILSVLFVLMFILTGAAAAETAGSVFDIEGDVLVKYNGPGGEVTVPEGIAILEENAFAMSGVTKVILPETLKEIRSYCFFNCPELTEITLPASLENLEKDMSSSIPSYYAQVFAYNPRLKAIEVEGENTRYTSIDGVLFTADGTRLVYYPDGKNPRGEYAIPEGTLEIGYSAFADPTLISVTLPATLTDLHDGGDFSMIPTLKEINVSPDNTHFYSRDGVLYSWDSTLVFYPNGKEGTDLSPEDFPKHMDAIDSFAFQGNRKLVNIELPEGVESLRWMCFSDMLSLENVIVPASVKEIYGFAFASNRSLEKVTILSTDVVFTDDSNILEGSAGAVLCGYENSTVQDYAARMGLKFESLGEAPAAEE